MSEDRERVLGQARRELEAGRHARAAALLERWLAREQRDAEAWSLLAAVRSEAGEWAGAEEAARWVVHLRPESARAWANWGVTLRKLGRTDEALRAQQSALRLDPTNRTAQREPAKLQVPATSPEPAAARASGVSDRCPKCGERVFPTDTQCLGCGADLVALRAELRREAEARERAEAAAREAAWRAAAEREIEALRRAGRSDEEIFGELTRAGRSEEDVRELLGIDPGAWVMALPEGGYAFVTNIDAANALRAEALGRVAELRKRIKRARQEIGEIRKAEYAAKVTARPGGRAATPSADDLRQREAVALLEESITEAQTLIQEWEAAIVALDAWIARSY